MSDRFYDTVFNALSEGLAGEVVFATHAQREQVTRGIIAALQDGDFDPSLVPSPEPEPPVEPRRMKWWYEEPGFETFHQYLKDLAEKQLREYLERPLPMLSTLAKQHVRRADGGVTFRLSKGGDDSGV